ncbi:MAG: hypothetical protein A3I66_01150 [Burkholderiales bacterium RIFCSPLOWO2_02_FULL_57_36]|nr:MAG: hypothetical protein A3I66_01150 [Burkholderiales bacterium RIFCSPLOWO2_02_FULL_57_36]
MTLLTIDEPDVPSAGKPALADHPLFRLGFRPFYLLAAAFAAVSVPLWMARYFGWLQSFAKVDLNWHVHEMIFGFAIAVIIGFIFTAARNWTGLWTPTKGYLAALAGLWIAGRIAMLTSGPLLAAMVDLLFLPLAAWPIFRVLQRSGNQRNMFLIGLLGLLALANAVFHGAVLGWLPLSPVQPIHAAILIIVVLESVIGGRVIPGFTGNVIASAKPVVNVRHDRISIAVTVLACVAWIAGLPALTTAALAIAAACSQLIRLAGWKPHTTLRHPLLWILHVSYAWIPVGFILLALSALNLVSQSAALHVLAVGSMAGLIIGMITRTALGHTGRPLKAGKAEIAMYLLIQIGVICRFAAAMLSSDLRDTALVVAAAAWASAFVIYLFVYGPYLVKPRVDGKEG